MKKILVTGAAGFIGSHFIDLLLEETDWDIYIVDRFSYAGNPDNLQQALRNDRVRLFAMDIAEPTTYSELDKYTTPDYIVNLAAESFVDASIHGNRDIFVQSNVKGVQMLLDWAVKHSISRFVQVSTDEVYGDLPIDSDDVFTTLSPLKPRNPYAASKAAADLLAQSYATTFGLDVVITRCSNN